MNMKTYKNIRSFFAKTYNFSLKNKVIAFGRRGMIISLNLKFFEAFFFFRLRRGGNVRGYWWILVNKVRRLKNPIVMAIITHRD